jgi:hypothetical protein
MAVALNNSTPPNNIALVGSGTEEIVSVTL